VTHLSETVGVRGAYETLRSLEVSSVTAYSAEQIEALMEQCGIDEPQANLENFVAANLLHRDGDQFGLTTLGIRTCLLLEAINGGDLKDIYRRLSRLDTSLRMYELIREGMTKSFLQNLCDRPGFGRLYFCSPWINLDQRQQDMLAHAVVQVERRRGNRPEILVITRPEKGTDRAIPATLKLFQDLGATIFLNKRLHTKLYIREPDTSGGYAMAIVGSQNLTRSRYLELGIRINSDGQMIDQLIAYFLELTSYGYEA
jgi:hypothetical protein